MERRVRSDRLRRSAVGRPREKVDPHRADLKHEGCWWFLSHLAPHVHQSVPLVLSCLLFPPHQWALGGSTRQRLSSGRESDRDLSEGNPQGHPKSAEKQTTRPQNPTFELDSQLAPRNSRHQRTLHCTISPRKPPKPLSGRQVPQLKPCSNWLFRLA